MAFGRLALALLVTPAAGFAPHPSPALRRFSDDSARAATPVSSLRRMRPLASSASENNDPDAIMSDDPMILRLEEQCAQLNGGDWNDEVGLMQLLNPSKVVNLERELEKLREDLAAAQAENLPNVGEIEATIAQKEAKQVAEMRGVMRDWLKAVFVWQSVLSVVVCGLVSYDALPGFPHLNLAIRVLGFWGIWLFTIPSLRSRKPGGFWGMSQSEKSALDISFLLTPLANIGVANFSKDPAVLFWANIVVLGACYAWFFIGPGADAEGSALADASLPEPIKFAIQALDFGSGSERGLSKTTREKIQAREKQAKDDEEEAVAEETS